MAGITRLSPGKASKPRASAGQEAKCEESADSSPAKAG
jgi:hypothetical protein